MHRLNIFLEHIYEAAQQRGTTFESMLSEAHKWDTLGWSATSGGFLTALTSGIFSNPADLTSLRFIQCTISYGIRRRSRLME